MKQNLKILIGALTLSALASAASAQIAGDISTARQTPSAQPNADEAIRKTTADESGTAATAVVGAAKSADLIDRDVLNHQGEKLGSVREIAVDVESGRIVQVILATGGFLGIGATETAVPPGAFVVDTESQELKLDAGKQHLLGAPPFDDAKWSEAFTTEGLAATYKHFGLESPLDLAERNDQAERPSINSDSGLGGIQRASEIVGMPVANLENEAIGEVEEILFDLAGGRILALVVTSGEFLGIAGELSAIPPSAFRFTTDRELLQIDISKADLGAAPHFKSDQWPDFTQADTAGAIFAAHSVEPHFRTGKAADAGAVARTSKVTTQGTASADLATTTAIKSEIRSLENVSANARNVSVVTNEGRTTLSGPVDTAEEKALIGEIADRKNQKEAVENLLVVKIAKTESE